MDQPVKGRRVPTGTILLVLSLLTALIPAPGAANQGGANTPSSARQVERFPRPEGRIKPPEGETGSPIRYACPDTLEMCRKFWALVPHFLNNPTIPVRHRELLVLRTSYLSRVEFEWGSHVRIAQEAGGITEQEISRVTQGPDAPGWSEFDAALLRAADELHSNRFITDATWQTLAGRYTDQQLVEVVLTVGNYTMLGMYFNTIGVPLEPGMAQVPN